ncbi:hypothetical protein EK21DRAFT_88473 [Setomelanomma holmii]|uniref:Uncharacterized protein n=1 Tax=Setomelanomma holmii TaxID=210430 RepID=A0A9P4LL03_9PLEO|nr:hypothetical protein EK21DRAFT_88473 [Setomelanomma holmii]
MNFRHSKDWTQSIYSERWYCDLYHQDADDSEDMESTKKEELIIHQKSQHDLTPSQVEGRSRRNRRVAKEGLFACPICNVIPPETAERISAKPYQLLSAQISGHLKSLALLSISYPDAGRSDEGSAATISAHLAEDGGDDPASLQYQQAYRQEMLEDISSTESLDDGGGKVEEDIFPGAPPLNEPSDWGSIGRKETTTDPEILERFLCTPKKHSSATGAPDRSPENQTMHASLPSNIGKAELSEDPDNFDSVWKETGINDFIKEEVTDKALPLTSINRATYTISRSTSTSETLSCFRRWKSHEREMFLKYQHMMTSVHLKLEENGTSRKHVEDALEVILPILDDTCIVSGGYA